MVLGESNKWILTVNYYDDKNRLLQSVKDVYPGGIYRLQYRYDFLGNVLESCETNTFGGKENRILKKYVYDKRSRLLSEQYSINNGPLKYVSKHYYSELGEKSKLFLGLQNSVDYKYDIRGCLTELKSNVFEMGLSYGTKSSGVGNLAFTSQYTGNISAIDWKFKSPK